MVVSAHAAAVLACTALVRDAPTREFDHGVGTAGRGLAVRLGRVDEFSKHNATLPPRVCGAGEGLDEAGYRRVSGVVEVEVVEVIGRAPDVGSGAPDDPIRAGAGGGARDVVCPDID